MTRFVLASFAILALIATAVPASAHCQIPCGIYDDELRVQLIEEHITTIEKSMNQIIAIPKTAPIDYNQLVRWVDNKETHATEIQDIVTAYFMAGIGISFPAASSVPRIPNPNPPRDPPFETSASSSAPHPRTTFDISSGTRPKTPSTPIPDTPQPETRQAHSSGELTTPLRARIVWAVPAPSALHRAV
jgi:hypothetical protein